MQHSSEVFGNWFLLDSFVPNNSFALKLPKQNNKKEQNTSFPPPPHPFCDLLDR